MSHLLASIYDDRFRAAEVLAALRRDAAEQLPDIDDAATVTRDGDGQVRLQRPTLLTSQRAPTGEVWRPLVGALLLYATAPDRAPEPAPEDASASGATASEYGLDGAFVSRLHAQLQPDTSALLVLLRRVLPSTAAELVAPHGGTLIESALAPDAEARLLFRSLAPPVQRAEGAREATRLSPPRAEAAS